MVFLLSVGILTAAPLAPDPVWAGLPLALSMVGTFAALFFAPALLHRWGPKRGLLLGFALGALGVNLVVAGLTTGHFALVCGGFLVYGLHQAFVLPFRWSAGLWVGLAAAVLGPLVGLGGRDLGAIPFVGSFLVLLGVLALQAMLTASLPMLVLPPAEPETRRPWRERLVDPSWRLAVTALALGSAAQGLLLAATPVAMHEYGHPFWASMAVLVAYGLAVGLASALSPVLLRRWGARRLIAGGLVLLAAQGAALLGTELGFYLGALTLLGLGWGLLYAGARNLGAKGRSGGLVFLWAAFSSFGAGAWERPLGWPGLQLLSLALLAVVAAVLLTRRPGVAGS